MKREKGKEKIVLGERGGFYTTMKKQEKWNTNNYVINPRKEKKKEKEG